MNVTQFMLHKFESRIEVGRRVKAYFNLFTTTDGTVFFVSEYYDLSFMFRISLKTFWHHDVLTLHNN